MEEIIIQAIGIVAMVFNVLSYQGKNAKQIIFIQFVSSLLFSVNFYLLGAYTGALLNVFAVLRALYLFRYPKPQKAVYFVCLVLIFTLFALTFTVFQKPFTVVNVLIELLPTLAMCVQTYALFKNDATKIRYFSYFVSPCWLAYNSINFSLGAILCEAFALVSITVGVIRFKNKPKSEVEK